MKIEKSSVFSDILIFTPTVYHDDRGYFYESYNKLLSETLNVEFVQENHSVSKKNVVRGLHYQWQEPAGKLCRVVCGSLIDYVVDIRKGSLTYGNYDRFVLSEENRQMIWIPPGFAHGFVSLEDNTHLVYKCTSLYNPSGEGAINPFDSLLNISFPISKEEAIMSDKDENAQSFAEYNKDPKF
jgi:dTDP-4-dehydrorhamnose 3,5-epimerase